MKNFKKFLTLVLAVMMVVSSFAFSTSAATTKFEDVDADNETLVKAVDLLNYMGVAKGTSETTFGADELVTRQQFALFIYRLMKGGKDAPANASNTTKFTDLEDSTYFYAISWANATGIVNGKSATTFGPKDPIKLQEAYAMITRALGWEAENNLVYPYGHIEVAEQDGVALDTGLASSVGYADELTRGDMAVLLYNAFFAETGKEVVETNVKTLDSGKLVIEETVTHNTLCEEVFDVVEVEYKAVATPNYELVMDGYEGEATYDLGYDAVYFQKVIDSEENDAPADVYLTAEQLGMEADELNDCFLGEFTMFVTLDEDDDIEKVLFADCNMTKKTTSDLKFSEIASNKKDSYFADSEGEAKLLSGKVVIDGTDEAYFFNAPYTYANEAYGDVTEAEDKYDIRNSKNLQAIKFSMVTEDDVNVYTIALDEDKAITNEYDEDGLYADAGLELIEAFYNVYYDGLYEADLYDINGDGLYDYINYKPYVFFQVDTDEDEYFEDYDDASDIEVKNGVPYVYVNGATVLGEEFASEDYVIGYFSTDLDVVKVVAVVEPTVATVDSFKRGTGIITLSTGDKVDAVSAWKLFYNEDAEIVWDLDAKRTLDVADSEYFKSAILDEDEAEYYIYNGVLVYADGVDKNVKFTENLIIPTHLVDDEDSKYYKPIVPIAATLESEDDLYKVYAYVDGVAKYVKVEVDDEVDAPLFDADTLKLNGDYADKLCTYTVKNDIYTIRPLATAVYDLEELEDADDEDEVDPINDVLSTDIDLLGYKNDDDKVISGKADDQVYTEDLGSEIAKVSGSKFDIGFERKVNIKSYSKILVKYTKKNNEGEIRGVEYIELEAADLAKKLDTTFELKAAIISNNDESLNVENLVILYAETDEKIGYAGKTSNNDIRIVSNYDIAQDDEGNWRVFYELYDPFTGAKVYDVPSKESVEKIKEIKTYELDSKLFVKLVDGMVEADVDNTAIEVHDEDEATYSIDAANLVWIAEVDTDEGEFRVVPYDSGLTSAKDVEDYVETYEEADAKDIYGHDIESAYVAYDKNTVVSVMTYGEMTDSMWNWGTMSLSDMNAVASAKKELLCYNNNALTGKDNDQYTTRYADYVKAYVSIADHDVDTDEKPVAEYIIVIVNGKEGTVEYK